MKYRLLFLLAAFSLSAHAQNWSGVLDPSRAVNWSSAGATISTSRTQCTTSACSTISAEAGGSITASQINSAIASAPANSYVLLPSGNISLSAGLIFNDVSNVTLRGAGSNSTFLSFSAGVNCKGVTSNICVASGDINYWGGPSNTATWEGTSAVGTYNKGDTQVILSSVANLQIGNPLILDQVDDQTDNGGLYVGCERPDGSAECYSGANPGGFERGESALNTIRGQQQIVKVTSISGAGPYTVGITPGIYASNYSTAKSPGAWWATSPVQSDAIENLSIDNTGDGNDAILMFNCQGCWVKGIRSIVTSGTLPTGWFHVGWQICNHCTVRDSYFFGTGGDSYVVAEEIASDSLEENNIVQMPGFHHVYSSDCEGCVSGYNFTVNNIYVNSSAWLNASGFYHSIELFTLDEGNIASGDYLDSFHGTKVLNTLFRNRLDGREQNNGTNTTSSTMAIRLNPGARYANIVGNILGTPGYHTSYKSMSGSSTGIVDCGAYPEVGMTPDSLSCSTSIFWGNWDNVTNAVRWCGNVSDPGWGTTCASTSEVPSGLSSYPNPVPVSTTLPASFYLSSKPSWWPSGKAWPLIGPDVTGGNVGQCSGGTYNSSEVTSSQSSQCSGGGGTFTALSNVVSSPAMDCYFNVMGGVANGTGSALNFDPSLCYQSSSTSSTQPPSPTGLTGTLH